MQFNFNRKVGGVVHVEFTTPQKADVWESLINSFEKIGGKCTDLLKDWTFPPFISSQVIQEIIRNTCFVCGGLMKDSTAYKNEDLQQPMNDGIDRTKVFINAGMANQIKVRKCSSCGHSHT